MVGIEPRDGESAAVVGIERRETVLGLLASDFAQTVLGLFVCFFFFFLMRICIFFWIYGFDFLEVSMLIMLEFFVLRLILSGLINWVCLRFCAVIFSSFFPYYSPKPLHEPSGRNHGLDLQRRSTLSPSVADLHHHPALYPSLLCAKRPICAGGSSNHCRSSVGMFLDFFFLWV